MSMDSKYIEDLIESGEGSYEAVLAAVEQLLKEDNDTLSEALVDRYEDEYETLAEETFRMAIRSGCAEYVREHADYFELNDDCYGSSYLSETRDPEIRDILIEAGAVPNPEDYDGDYRFLYQSYMEDGYDLEESLADEIREKVLAELGITAEVFTERFLNNPDEDLPGKLKIFTYNDIQSMLWIADTASLPKDYEGTEVYVHDLIDLMEIVGIDVCCEGSGGPHGHDGWEVYFVV